MLIKPKKGDPIKAEWGQEVVEMLTKALSGDPQPPAKPRKGDTILPEWGEAVVDCLSVIEPWVNFGWKHYRSFVLPEDIQQWEIDISDLPESKFFIVLTAFQNVHPSETCDIFLFDSLQMERVIGGMDGMRPNDRGISMVFAYCEDWSSGVMSTYGFGYNLDFENITELIGPWEFSNRKLYFKSVFDGNPAGLIGRGAKVIILYYSS